MHSPQKAETRTLSLFKTIYEVKNQVAALGTKDDEFENAISQVDTWRKLEAFG